MSDNLERIKEILIKARLDLALHPKNNLTELVILLSEEILDIKTK